MDIRKLAKTLGRRGGQARARRLSAEQRRRIAAMGAAARLRSLEAARNVLTNFRYAAMVVELQGGRPAVERMKTCSTRLPGIYRSEA